MLRFLKLASQILLKTFTTTRSAKNVFNLTASEHLSNNKQMMAGNEYNLLRDF